MGKRWELLESNRVANSSTLFWSRNFNLGEKTISRVIINIRWEYFKNLHQRWAWSHLIWDEGGCTFKEGVQLFVFHSVQCLFTSKQLDDFGKPGTHDMIFCPFTVCSNFFLEALTIHRPWAPSSQSVNGKLRHLWMLISSVSPTQTFFLVLTNILKDQPELWTKTSGSRNPGQFAVLDEAGANLFLLFYGSW